MTRAFRCARRLAAAPILGTLAARSPRAGVACSSTPLQRSRARAPAPAPPPPATPPRRRRRAAATTSPPRRSSRPRARWVAARWSDLPGWDGDRLAELWPAFLRSCERPAPAWARRLREGARGAVRRSRRRRRRAPGCSSSCGRIASSRSKASRSASRPATSSRSSRRRACRAPAFACRSTRRRPTWRRASPTGRASSSRRCRRRDEPARPRDRLAAPTRSTR